MVSEPSVQTAKHSLDPGQQCFKKKKSRLSSMFLSYVKVGGMFLLSGL